MGRFRMPSLPTPPNPVLQRMLAAWHALIAQEDMLCVLMRHVPVDSSWVLGSHGACAHRDVDDDATIKFFITPTVIDAVAECDNGINASADIPVEIEHYFVVAQDAMAADGECTMELSAGDYRYYPEGDELLLEYEGGPQVVLTRHIPG